MKVFKFTKFFLALFTLCIAQGPIFAGGISRQKPVPSPDPDAGVLEQLQAFTAFGITSTSMLYHVLPTYSPDHFESGKVLTACGKAGLVCAAAGLVCVLAKYCYDKLPNLYKQKIRATTAKVGRLLLSPKIFGPGLIMAAGGYALGTGDLKTSMGILGVGSYSYLMRNF